MVTLGPVGLPKETFPQSTGLHCEGKRWPSQVSQSLGKFVFKGHSMATSQEGTNFCDNDLVAFSSSLLAPTGHHCPSQCAPEYPDIIIVSTVELYTEENQGSGDMLQRSPRIWQSWDRKLGLPPHSSMWSWEFYWALASGYGRGPRPWGKTQSRSL